MMRRTKTVEVNGKKYELQSIPFKTYLEINDRHMGPYGIARQKGFSEELLKHCVINPKVTLDDFDDDYEAGVELIKEIESFLKTKDNGGNGKEKSAE